MAIGGESPAWIRLLPCLAGIVTVVPLVALARGMFVPLDVVDAPYPGAAGPLSSMPRSQLAAIGAIAAAAGSPLLVALSNELRGYSFLLLFTALSLLAFGRVARAARAARAARGVPAAERAPAGAAAPPQGELPRTDLRSAVAWLAAANVVLVYTHYFGWLVVAAECGAALFWNRCALRPTLLSAVVAGVAFAPWAIAVVVAAGNAAHPLQNVDWISRPSLGDVPVFFDALVARVITPRVAVIGAVVVIVPLVALAVAVARAGRHATLTRRAAALAWFAAFPVAVVFAVSVLGGRSAFVPRYLVVAAPAWWLLVGMAVAAFGSPTWARPETPQPPSRVPTGAILTVAIFSAFTLTAGVMREVRGGEKVQWNYVVAAVAKDAGPAGGTVYSLEGFTALPLTYYAAEAAAAVTVRPVRDLNTMETPAWLVVRSTPGDSSAALGGALIPRGLTLRPIATAEIPSQRVVVYRVERP